ncbi:MAG: hypothetical protein ACP6IP_04960 [Candidatus Njordarchaeia archaeon]
MIYLLYLAESSGVPLWKYEHPRTPDEIIENITGKDDSIIVGYLSAISHFSKVTLGSQVQMMNFGKFNMYYWYFTIKEKQIIGLVICDASDKKEAVYKTIYEFLEKNRDLLEEYVDLAEKILENDELRRQLEIKGKILSGNLQEILDGKIRSIKYLANRDLKTIAIGSIVTYLFFLFTLTLTKYLNDTMGWFARGEIGALVSVIVILDLILPSMLLGYLVGYRDGALYGGFITGIAIILTLTVIYFSSIEQWALQWKLGIYVYPLWGVIVFILGGAIGLMASFVSEYLIEYNTLIPPQEKPLAVIQSHEIEEEKDIERIENDE